ncbi:MAG: tetratricopeptide repeat protein [Alcanivoracaceae bacterium]|jgi:predicted negative regulator of RcsB-dependent stress response|nr:tetratricopeptide repeat protein [Alcanivoracaceae bacterium]
MVDYSEEEQVERLRKWWDENGISIVVAVLLSVAALWGWRYWQGQTQQKAEAASEVYQQMVDAMEQSRAMTGVEGATDGVRSSAEQLVADYASTSYADYARLALAALSVSDQSYTDAAALLREVMDSPATAALGWTARARLARVLLHSGDLEGAKQALNASWPESWQGQAFELRGDLARAQGDLNGAREAYQSALQALTADGAGHRELVQMKLDDLVPAS